MKRIILTLVAVLAFTVTKAQTIEKYVDEMDDTVYYLPMNAPVFLDNEKDGFKIQPSIDDSKEEFSIRSLIVQSYGAEWSCVEDSTLIIMYTDETKDKFTSWNEFNCKGTSYFSIKGEKLDNFFSKEMKKVRLTNGKTYKSYTFDSPSPDYFVRFGQDLKNKNFKVTVN
jgi:hypothetical protein